MINIVKVITLNQSKTKNLSFSLHTENMVARSLPYKYTFYGFDPSPSKERKLVFIDVVRYLNAQNVQVELLLRCVHSDGRHKAFSLKII